MNFVVRRKQKIALIYLFFIN